MKLQNRVAIVTGGGKGIGREICLGLSKQGAKIVIAELDIENSNKVIEEIKDSGSEAIAIKTDISNENSVKNLILETIKKFNKIDILINNAGIRHVKKLDDHNLNDWNDMLSVNLTGPYICCKAVIPEMKKVGKGKIINFGSIASFMGRPDRVGYVAAKSGVLGLTRALAIDLKGTNINVNTICPGLISTPFNKKYAEDPTHGEKWGKETIVGRWGLPSDIVGAAIFLSSDDSDFINGTEIKIDGGWLAAKTREGEVD
jgi:NAD(P)-dependent dehydrogenase (short-subunit alcohol dehydrogenase family)|tara:strand:- start:1526 stop:2299 length:774 start_codon:yes stop_codon:yes gene_type:complete